MCRHCRGCQQWKVKRCHISHDIYRTLSQRSSTQQRGDNSNEHTHTHTRLHLPLLISVGCWIESWCVNAVHTNTTQCEVCLTRTDTLNDTIADLTTLLSLLESGHTATAMSASIDLYRTDAPLVRAWHASYTL